MKIILYCQAASDMIWSKRYDSRSFAEAGEEERRRGIAPISVNRSDASAYRIYTGTTRASMETASALFITSETPEQTELLDDVVLAPFRETDKTLPLWVWRFMGKAQWTLGSKRQPESRRKTKERANQLVDRLEAEGRDCVLITSGLLLETLRDALYRRGYCIEGGSGRIKPLDRIRATKQTLHCGGCIHNCMLSNPGCGIGKDKARLRGIEEIVTYKIGICRKE